MKGLAALTWLIALLLNGIGLATLYSSTSGVSSLGIKSSLRSQLIYSGLAFSLALLATKIPKNIWSVLTPWSYLMTLGLLIWTLISGEEINHAASWVRLGGISIQPSEILKITLILALARVLRYQRHEHPLQEIISIIFLSGIPMILILLQPDLGSALTLVPLILALCHTAGYDLPHLGILIGCGTLALITVIIGSVVDFQLIPLHSYQLSRIIRLLHQDNFSPLTWLGSLKSSTIMGLTLVSIAVVFIKGRSWKRWVWIFLICAHSAPLIYWLSLDSHLRDQHIQTMTAKYAVNNRLEEPQLLQAKYALGNGGILGQGWKQGEQTQYQRLAYNYSDLIFASFAEEWGLLGSSVVLGLFASLIFCLMLMAQNTFDPFASLCIYGVAYILASQVFIHIGYTVGLIPMTGITLPFFSAGGSSLIAMWMGIGLSTACHQPLKK